MQNENPLASITLVNMKQVSEAVGRSPSTVADWVREGRFPAPLQAKPGALKQWRLEVVERWLRQRERAGYVKPSKRGKLRNRELGTSYRRKR
jgi:predicted DNA-binding transcriptional regulator AlpA